MWVRVPTRPVADPVNLALEQTLPVLVVMLVGALVVMLVA